MIYLSLFPIKIILFSLQNDPLDPAKPLPTLHTLIHFPCGLKYLVTVFLSVTLFIERTQVYTHIACVLKAVLFLIYQNPPLGTKL